MVADVTLGDYAGFIFLELIKAREMADAYSRSVGERYAKDPVLQYFSVPRFKVPKMQLTIPVLVSGARFTQTVRLDLPLKDFTAAVNKRVEDVLTLVEMSLRNPLIRPRPIPREVREPVEPPTHDADDSESTEELVREFHQQLVANPDPLRPDALVRRMWSRIVRASLEDADLLEAYLKSDPKHELLERSTNDLLEYVRARTVIDHTAIESLLIDPETNVVKNGSSETSVFTVTAELLEEGFYLRSVRDEETQQVSTIVEFE